MLLWTPYINPRLDNQFENHVMPPHEYKNLMNLRIVMNFPPHLELTNQVSRETYPWNDQTSHMFFHYTSHTSHDITWPFWTFLGFMTHRLWIIDMTVCTYVQDENHQEIQCVLELNIWDHFRLLYYPTRVCCGYLSISIQNQLEKWLIVCQLLYNHPKYKINKQKNKINPKASGIANYSAT